MSKRRTMTGVDLDSVARGPGGERLCRWCERPVPGGRRTFCSPECVHEWRLRRDPRYVREMVMARDDGICSACGMDAIAEYHRLRLLGRERPAAYAATALALKIPAGRTRLWECHHAVAVIDGGGECGLDGFSTMCLWCHRIESGRQTRERKKSIQ